MTKYDSEFHNAIRWLKNGEFQLLFFIVGFENGEEQSIVTQTTDKMNATFYDYSEQSSFPVSLLEIRVKNSNDAPNEIELINSVFSRLANNSFAVICMFEGAYIGCSDLIDEQNHNQIYAVLSHGGSFNAISDEYRHSDEWKAIVDSVQKNIRERYSG